MITFQCHACNHVLKVAAQHAGKKAKCTKCQTPLVIPQLPAAAPEPYQPPPPALRPVAPAPQPVDELEEVPPSRGSRHDDDDRPRKRRRDRDDRDFDDRDDRDRDDDRSIRKSSGGKPDWSKVQIGLLLNFIAIIVIMSGYGCEVVALLIQTIMGIANSPSQGMFTTIRIFHQLGVSIIFCGLVLTIVGQSFWIFVKSNRNGNLGFAIASLAVTSVGAILYLVFSVIPAFDRSSLAFFGITWGDVILLMLGMLAFRAGFMLQAFFLRSLAMTVKERRLTNMLPLILSFVLLGYTVVGTLLGRILAEALGGRGAFIVIVLIQWVVPPIMYMLLVMLMVRSSALRKIIVKELR